MNSSAPPTSNQKVIEPSDKTTTTLKHLDQALSRIYSYAEIRLFIAGTANFGHQASSVDLLLRLAFDYEYPGLITVVYDKGDPDCGSTVEKLNQLLNRYNVKEAIYCEAPSETLPLRLHRTRMRWFSIEEFSSSRNTGNGVDLVDFGFTGGAEIGRIYYRSLADMLNVRVALKAQPFQWPWCRDGIDFHSTTHRPPVDLLGDDCLGWRLFHTAYQIPGILFSPMPQASRRDRQYSNDAVLQRLLPLQTHFSCVYGLRQNGVCDMDPANVLYIYILALLDGLSSGSAPAKGGGAKSTTFRRALVINLDKFWTGSFDRLEDSIRGNFPPVFQDHQKNSKLDLSPWVRCIASPDDLPDALDWFDEQLAPQAKDATVPYKAKILYLHIGFVSPEWFVQALDRADLPIIFEGQHTASTVASLGKPYLKLQDSVLGSFSQVLRIPDDTTRHRDVINRIEAASLYLQRGALGQTELQQSVVPIAGLVSECIDSDIACSLSIYLKDLRSYYQQRGADKWENLLAAWYKYGCLDPPATRPGVSFEAFFRKNEPRLIEEVELELENARKMLVDFGVRRCDGPGPKH